MTFQDLPRDWPARPLSDPVLAADVLDLCVTDGDRIQGGLSVLLCRRDDTLAQPVFVGDVPEDDLCATISRILDVTEEMGDVGAIVVGIVRSWGSVTDADRMVHQRAIEVCGSAGLRLLGTFVVTTGGVTHLPVAAELLARHGAA